MKRDHRNVENLLRRSRPPELGPRMDAALARVMNRGRAARSARKLEPIVELDGSPRARFTWLELAAAAILVVGLVSALTWDSDEPLYRIAAGAVLDGASVRSTGRDGAVLTLVDGSRVEMRADSELAVERAQDGLRIRLSNGGIIVNAAKQRTGHLYVQTKDVTVSVVGTVFLVNADPQGSLVAVIEGEVRVQQGSTEMRLRPGEQVKTNPDMASRAVKQEVAWSRQAMAHAAMLPQATSSTTKESVAFEVAAIRPSGAATPSLGARGGGGANSISARRGCTSSSEQVDPRRLVITRATFFQLAVWAYPVPNTPNIPPFFKCELIGSVSLISGGPEWTTTELWDVEAAIPEGSFSGTPDLSDNRYYDPKLQQMLQTLLAERFKVVMRHETREMPVYLLKVGKNGPKFNGHGERFKERYTDDGQPKLGPLGNRAPILAASGITDRGSILEAWNVSMQRWVERMTELIPRGGDRLIFDRTGLMGTYDFHFYRDVPLPQSVGAVLSLHREAVKAMGLELEEATAPFDVWVIESVQRPSQN